MHILLYLQVLIHHNKLFHLHKWIVSVTKTCLLLLGKKRKTDIPKYTTLTVISPKFLGSTGLPFLPRILCRIGPPSKLSNWAHVYFFPLCAQLGFVSFLPWVMNLGGGAVVEGDYRPLSSKPWEETCYTTGYTKTPNHRLVIKIHILKWCSACGGKPVKPVVEKKQQCPIQTHLLTFHSRGVFFSRMLMIPRGWGKNAVLSEHI